MRSRMRWDNQFGRSPTLIGHSLNCSLTAPERDVQLVFFARFKLQVGTIWRFSIMSPVARMPERRNSCDRCMFVWHIAPCATDFKWFVKNRHGPRTFTLKKLKKILTVFEIPIASACIWNTAHRCFKRCKIGTGSGEGGEGSTIVIGLVVWCV